MKSLYRNSLIALSLISSTLATAQNTNSGYFIDEYTYRHHLNPAYGNENNYVAMPVLGNVNFGIRGNLHLTDVLYNVNGQTTTFLNPLVNTDEFMSNIEDHNIIGSNIRLDILSAGFKAWGGYNTIGLNLRTNIDTSIPRGIFSLAKEGLSNTAYDISDFNVHADVYSELSLGHSRQITEQLRVGGALKILFGTGNVDANFNRAQLALGEDAWTAITDATIHASLPGLSYKTTVNSSTGHHYVNGIDIDTSQFNVISGFGAALDLGAIYRLNDDWEFSLALNDLGFISWSSDIVASTDGEQTFTTGIYTFSIDDESLNSFDNELEKIKDDISALYELNDMGDQGSRTRMLGATLNVGAKYTFPFYRKLDFGLLNTTRLLADHTWTEFRLSANVAPVDIFSAGVNFSAGTYGCGFGWLVNLHPKGFNLFAGMDHTFFRIAKQGIPLNSNASFNIGINFPF
ncbi:MAG: DUF5723 family protein [Muribaculaceae bacterium]|nr:DUF5723 family protein [Muribaculaceae bacterium]